MADSIYIKNLPSASSIIDTDYLILEQTDGTTKTTVSNLKNALDIGEDYVPITRTINGHELSEDIVITAEDVGLGDTYVPTSRTINSKSLESDITISAEDVGLGNVINVEALAVESNLSDVADVETARDNLNVYSKTEVYSQSETYTQAEIQALIAAGDDPDIPVVFASTYGVKADGTTDDTAALQAAITAAGTGYLVLSAGTMLITSELTISTGVTIIGQGVDVSIIKAASTYTEPSEHGLISIRTEDDADSGVGYWGIRDLTVDGNSFTTFGVYAQGYSYTLQNISAKNCGRGGIHSKWTSGVLQSAPNPGALLQNITIYNSGEHGIEWYGPYKSNWTNIRIKDSSTSTSGSYSGIYVSDPGYDLTINNIHISGDDQKYGLDLRSANITVNNVIVDSCTTAYANIGNHYISLTNAIFYLKNYSSEVSDSAIYGVVLGGEDAEIKTIYAPNIQATILNCKLGAVHFVAGHNMGNISVIGYVDTVTVADSVGYAGTPPPTWNIDLYIDYAASAGAFSQTCAPITLTNLSEAPTDNTPSGTMYYDTAKGTIGFYNGISWFYVATS